MKTKVYVLFFVLFCFSISLAQEVRSKDKKPEVKTTLSTKTLNATASTGDSVVFKDSDSNTLIKITDEGTTGSVTIPPGTAPSATANKLYNVGSKLYFNGSLLASSINDLSDAKTDSLSIFWGKVPEQMMKATTVMLQSEKMFSFPIHPELIILGMDTIHLNTTQPEVTIRQLVISQVFITQPEVTTQQLVIIPDQVLVTQT